MLDIPYSWVDEDPRDLTEGWWFPDNALRAHFVRYRFSFCGRFEKKRGDPLYSEQEAAKWPKCKQCFRQVSNRKNVKIVKPSSDFL